MDFSVGEPYLKKILKEFFDLLLEMFFPVDFVVHHHDRNVLSLHILDESVLVVVKISFFHLCVLERGSNGPGVARF